MSPPIDKGQVERQFSRAAESYDGAAQIQQKMSDHLMDTLQPYLKKDGAMDSLRIIDLGCGTGYALKRFRQSYPSANLCGVDISEAMLNQASKHLPCSELLKADMETFASSKKADVLFSNASIQWCELDAVLKSANSSLNKGGVLAYTSFGPKTHTEIAEAWKKADGENSHRIKFLNKSDHINALDTFGFELVATKTQLYQPKFDNAEELLLSIKNTGATNASDARSRGMVSRKKYMDFISYLNALKPIQLSYEALVFIALKR